MSERQHPDMDKADETFSADTYSGDELRKRRTQAQQQRRKKYFRRTRNTAVGAAGLGIVAFAADKGLDKRDAAERQATQDVAPLVKSVEEVKQANDARDARIAEAIEKAKQSAAAGEPAPHSGVIEVSEAGTTGYVDLDSPTPDDTTTVESPNTGGIAADQESTGGIEPDSAS